MTRPLGLLVTLAIACLLVYSVNAYPLPFGSFPQRGLAGFKGSSVGQQILEEAPARTGASNIVTSVVWDYRGYDTLGEATVLFTAVCSVAMLFRVLKRGRE